MFAGRYAARLSCLMGIHVAVQILAAQTRIDLYTQSKGVDFQGAPYTRPVKTSATLPATCTVNELLLLTTAPAGSNIYACLSANTWVPETGTAASLTVQNGGVTVGARGTENFVPAVGITNVVTDLGTKVNIQQGVDTAVILSQAAHQSGQALLCQSASGSGSAYTCAMTPTLTGYTSGMLLHWTPDVSAVGGGTTLNVDTLGAVPVMEADGTTIPTPSEIVAGRLYPIWYDGTVFRLPASGSAGSGGSGGTAPAGAPNKVLATDPAGAVTDTATLRALVPADIPASLRARGFQVTFGGADLVPNATVYVTMPYACTASGYAISTDPSGTATITLSKIADGTSLPTSANLISTNGFSLSTGNRIHSSDLTDLSTTAWAAWDTSGVTLSGVAGNPTHVNFTLECDQ